MRGGCQTLKTQTHIIDGRLHRMAQRPSSLPPGTLQGHWEVSPLTPGNKIVCEHSSGLTLQQSHILLSVMPTNPSDFGEAGVQVHVGKSLIKFTHPDTLCHRSELPEMHTTERKSAVFI